MVQMTFSGESANAGAVVGAKCVPATMARVTIVCDAVDVPLSEHQKIDRIVDNLDWSMEQVFLNANSAVKLPAKELDLLKNCEEARDFMNRWMRETSTARYRLEELFAKDNAIMRIVRIQAVLDNIEFSEMNRADQRLETTQRSCVSVEKVLADIGYADKLKKAQEELQRDSVKGTSKWKSAKEGLGMTFKSHQSLAAKILEMMKTSKLSTGSEPGSDVDDPVVTDNPSEDRGSGDRAEITVGGSGGGGSGSGGGGSGSGGGSFRPVVGPPNPSAEDLKVQQEDLKVQQGDLKVQQGDLKVQQEDLKVQQEDPKVQQEKQVASLTNGLAALQPVPPPLVSVCVMLELPSGYDISSLPGTVIARAEGQSAQRIEEACQILQG